MKRGMGIDVNEAARARIRELYENFELVYVAFSGGKDSGVLLNLAVETAREMGRLPVDAVHYDMEAWYQGIADYVRETFCRPEVRPHWLCVPLYMYDGVSATSEAWWSWDERCPELWARPMPDHPSVVSDPSVFPFHDRRMILREFMTAWGAWFAAGRSCACLIGLRADESLNRFRAVANPGGRKANLWNGRPWTTVLPNGVVNAYPVYDWRAEDLWTANARFGWTYNRLYTLMRLAGVPLHEQRLCQPFGNDQRQGLWLYPLLEPETWARIVRRVPGANFGMRHAGEFGSVLGNRKAELPSGFTWETWAEHILASLPPEEQAKQRANLARYLARCGEPKWSSVCKVLLKNDHLWRRFSASDSRRKSARRRELAAKFGNL